MAPVKRFEACSCKRKCISKAEMMLKLCYSASFRDSKAAGLLSDVQCPCLQPGAPVRADPSQVAPDVRGGVPGPGRAHRLRDGSSAQGARPVHPPGRAAGHLQNQDCECKLMLCTVYVQPLECLRGFTLYIGFVLWYFEGLPFNTSASS